MKEKLRGLYAITDNTLTPSSTILQKATQALSGGAKILQLRDKQSSNTQIKTLSLELQNLCHSYDATFVLNDRYDIAIELGLDGLHIGKSDYDKIAQIRKDFSGSLGVSCYGDVSFAKEMQDMGVDYVAFGSFFASKTKPNSGVVNLEVLSQAKKSLEIPVCAIGGIDIQNVSEVMKHGVDMVSVINDIWTSQDIEQKAKEYAKLFKGKR